MRVAARPLIYADETAARRSLRDQIARLEAELSELSAHAPVDARGGPRLLSLAELEGIRDALVERTREARKALDEQGAAQEAARCTLEEAMLDPARHRWVQVSREQVGEPGCGTWHARPRFGLLGMRERIESLQPE